MTSHSALPNGDRIEIRIPADGVYVATLRMCAASLAARCDLTVDDIEDLRLAVDEACALLLPHVPAGGDLHAAFTLQPHQLQVVTRVVAADGGSVDRSGFAWTVLGALVSEVSIDDADEHLSIAIVKRREAAPQ